MKGDGSGRSGKIRGAMREQKCSKMLISEALMASTGKVSLMKYILYFKCLRHPLNDRSNFIKCEKSGRAIQVVIGEVRGAKGLGR